MQEQNGVAIPTTNEHLKKKKAKKTNFVMIDVNQETDNIDTKHTQNHQSNIYNKTYPNGNQDANIQNNKTLEMSDIIKDIRNKFILKVFGILLFLFLFTFGLIFLCQIEIIKNYLIDHPFLCLILIGGASIILCVSFIIMLCKPILMKAVPQNYIFLILNVIAMTLLLICLTIFFKFEYILAAVVLVIAICLGIFIISCFKRIDLRYIFILLIITIFLGFAYGILILFYRNYYLDFLYCLIGAFIFSLFLIYDTQRLYYPNEFGEFVYDIDDYIWASLTLYLDIIRLFVEILKLVGGLFGYK